jgi:hypothetical protein
MLTIDSIDDRGDAETAVGTGVAALTAAIAAGRVVPPAIGRQTAVTSARINRPVAGDAGSSFDMASSLVT